MGFFKKAVEAAKTHAKTQVEQAKADVQQAKADALAKVDQAKADALGKVEQVKADVQLTRDDPAAAVEQYRERKAAREAKRQAQARAAAARERAERAERIARATGRDGKIRAKGVAWDGHTLLLEGRDVREIVKEAKTITTHRGRVDGSGFAWGQSQRLTTYGGVQKGRSVSRTTEVEVPRPLKKGQRVIIPEDAIGGIDYHKGQIRVFVLDGREYLFNAPQVLAEAIEDTRTEETLVESRH